MLIRTKVEVSGIASSSGFREVSKANHQDGFASMRLVDIPVAVGPFIIFPLTVTCVDFENIHPCAGESNSWLRKIYMHLKYDAVLFKSRCIPKSISYVIDPAIRQDDRDP